MTVIYHNTNRGFLKPTTEEHSRYLAREIESAERLIDYHTSEKINLEKELKELQNDKK